MRVIPTSGVMLSLFLTGAGYSYREMGTKEQQQEYCRDFEKVDQWIRVVASDPSPSNIATMRELERQQTERVRASNGELPALPPGYSTTHRSTAH